MQLFLALSDGGATFQQYADMAKVAVHTALKTTSLRPHLLYDGSENEFTAWLRKRDVPVIKCRSSLRDQLANLEICKKDGTIAAAVRGVFLRVELPLLGESLGLDERVLYIDCDVIFQRDVVRDFAEIECEYFAVAGEFTTDDYENMNNGVMWMNLPALAKRTGDFKEYIRKNLVVLQKGLWSQTAYRQFFRTDGVRLWNELPPELNWKPYWGNNPDAGIIHFHGPKPFHRDLVSTIPELRHLSVGAYFDYCQLWDSYFTETV